MKSTGKTYDSARQYAKARLRMVREQVIARGIRDVRVIEAMQEVPRHLFVPEALYGQAYADFALPIGEGQTISQPYMVGYMSEVLGLRGQERVLEIGTGTGYQAAVLSHLAGRVYSVERIRSLLERARKNLDLTQCRNVITRLADGSYGWKEEAPFDAILVTAGGPSVPGPLVEQLEMKGTLVLPVGTRDSQVLLKVRRTPGGFSQEELKNCNFVALVGDHGWAKREINDPCTSEESS